MNKFLKSLIFLIAILSVSSAKSVDREQDEISVDNDPINEIPDTTAANEEMTSITDLDTEETSQSYETTTDETTTESTDESSSSQLSKVSSLFYITLFVTNILLINLII
jgi:hypothetical protein